MRAIELADRVGVPERSVHTSLEALVDAGLLVYTDDEFTEAAPVVPARDLDDVSMQDVLDALKGHTGRPDLVARESVDGAVDELFERYDDQRRSLAANMSLRTLAERARGALDDQGQKVPASPSE